MKKIISMILVFFLITTLIPVFTPLVNAAPTNWYVSPSGSDTIGDGTFDHPFLSIQKAMNESKNGDIINLRKGTYNNIWENINGVISGWEIRRSGASLSEPFIIQTYPEDLPAQAILDGSGVSFTNAYGILTIGRLNTHYNNIIIRDLTFKNSSKQGLTAYATSASGSCNNIIIHNCTFYNITENAIWFYKESDTPMNPFTNIFINNCTFDHIQNDASPNEGVTISGADGAIVCYNIFRNVRKINLVFANGCTNCEAHHNNFELTSHHSGEAIYVDAQEYNGAFCSWIRIHNNTIWGTAEPASGNYAIAVSAEKTKGSIHNITIENNIINRTGPDGEDEVYGIGIKHGEHIDDITIKQNTFYQSIIDSACINIYHWTGDSWHRIIIANNIFLMTGNTAYCIQFKTLPSTQMIVSFYNNCYYRTDGPTKCHSYTNAPTDGEPTAIIEDPECVNPSSGDFHLQKTSPCRDAADSNYATSADHDGYPRPQNGSYDIGAYEYILPLISIEVPSAWDALQDEITIQSMVTDPSGVEWVTYSIREPGWPYGIVIDPIYESLPASQTDDDHWQRLFDTTLLPDGYYVLYVNASDTLGHENHTTVNFSIRNWAVIEQLPDTPNSKAGRTIPVKFSLRIASEVDPGQPFVRNEQLTIFIYEKDHPEPILQYSTYGSHSTDYRINSTEEQYITNFKTLKTPKTYVVEIWRIPLLIGSFEFQTTK